MTTEASVKYDVKDLSLAAHGRNRIEWAATQMPVLRAIGERFERELPLAGLRIAACLHVTTETANLAITLKAGGADVVICASNPLSTQDDTAAALVAEYGISTFAIKGEDSETYYRHINAAIDSGPHLTMDDGCDLVTMLHTKRGDRLENVFAGTEETTTGVIRLRSMHSEGVLRYPVIAINEALTKHMFDNRYGTGQSTIDAIMRTTNVLLAGRTVVICGYGWCGRGVAMRAHGMGAHVIVTEVDPTRALEALMDGYRVVRLEDAARQADLVITVTGDINVVDRPHLKALKDGAILANAGQFNDEINIAAMAEGAAVRTVRDFLQEYRYADGRKLYLVAEGRLANISAAEGHPAAVMDMSFANQALTVEYLRRQSTKLEPGVYVVPTDIDRQVAATKLASLGVAIDTLTEEQTAYLASWQSGT